MSSDDKKMLLTVFNEANHGAVLEGDVHVEVLNVNVVITDLLLLLLVHLLEFLADFLQVGDIILVSAHVRVTLESIKKRTYVWT